MTRHFYKRLDLTITEGHRSDCTVSDVLRESESIADRMWFPEKIDRKNCSWVFEAGEAYRSIASLEMLATLFCLVAFGIPKDKLGHLQFSGGADNLGNKYVVTKMMTTKYPVCCVLMGVASILQTANASLDLHWPPTLQNSEADSLTN